MLKKISKTQSGIAGEYFVAAELSIRGFIASISLRNTKGIDIIVAHPNSYKSLSIQVKTEQNSSKKWALNKKAENNWSENLFYVFVNLNNGRNSPTYHIVPSKVVADYCRKSHQEWLNTPGRNGQKHNDNDIRNFKDLEDKYFNRWNLIKEKLVSITSNSC